MKSYHNIILFILLSIFWGAAFTAIKVVVTTLPPIFGAGLRVVCAIACLVIISAIFKKKLFVPAKYILRVWITGLFMIGLPFSLLFWGEMSVSPGLTGIINGSLPLWTFILGGIFIKKYEPFTLRKFLGLCLGIVGIIVIFLPKLHLKGGDSEFFGVLAIVLTIISYAVGTILNRYLITSRPDIDIYASNLNQHIVSLIFLFLVSLIFGEWNKISPSMFSWQVIVAIVYMGLFASALAWIIFFSLIKSWNAIRASAVTYIVPINAIIVDYLFFGNIPRTYEFYGAMAILSGIFVIQSSAIAKK
jgi:drug/metabolite transporter (DMT)-like permease